MENESKVKLLDCPFCGSKADLNAYPLRGKLIYLYLAQCESDKCGGSVGEMSHSEEEAAKKWNTRAAK